MKRALFTLLILAMVSVSAYCILVEAYHVGYITVFICLFLALLISKDKEPKYDPFDLSDMD